MYFFTSSGKCLLFIVGLCVAAGLMVSFHVHITFQLAHPILVFVHSVHHTEGYVLYMGVSHEGKEEKVVNGIVIPLSGSWHLIVYMPK